MKIAILQICSQLLPKTNLIKIRKLMDQLSPDCQACFLPECFLSLSDGKNANSNVVTEDNYLMQQIKQLAIDYQVALIGGSVAYQENGKVYNRSININTDGKIIAIYDKINLFRCHISDSQSVDESKIYSAGKKLKSFNFLGFHIGLSICFDLRFPEIYRRYYQEGVNLITAASAFTVPTGRAHWHTLNKARAIENQCYVIASAQWGQNHPHVQTYGHSLVVNPWGEIILDMQEGEGIAEVEIDSELIHQTRQKMDISPHSLTFEP